MCLMHMAMDWKDLIDRGGLVNKVMDTVENTG